MCSSRRRKLLPAERLQTLLPLARAPPDQLSEVLRRASHEGKCSTGTGGGSRKLSVRLVLVGASIGASRFEARSAARQASESCMAAQILRRGRTAFRTSAPTSARGRLPSRYGVRTIFVRSRVSLPSRSPPDWAIDVHGSVPSAGSASGWKTWHPRRRARAHRASRGASEDAPCEPHRVDPYGRVRDPSVARSLGEEAGRRRDSLGARSALVSARPRPSGSSDAASATRQAHRDEYSRRAAWRLAPQPDSLPAWERCQECLAKNDI